MITDFVISLYYHKNGIHFVLRNTLAQSCFFFYLPAPRLGQLHRQLDAAVCAAYGWEPAILDDEEEILRRLLALNLARAAQSG